MTEDSSWKNAKAYAESIVNISQMFTGCIRQVQASKQRMAGQNVSLARELVVEGGAPLVRLSPSLRTILYRGAKSLRAGRFEEKDSFSVEDLISQFSPDEFTAIIAVSYLARRIRSKVDGEEWKQQIEPRMLRHMEVGYLVGDAISRIGAGKGMLVGGMRYLALALFASHDFKGFKTYRRKLDQQHVLFDVRTEYAQWGCSHLQIASLLMQRIGFGRESLAMALGDNKADAGSGPVDDTWPLAMRWMESLQLRGAWPEGEENVDDLGPRQILIDLKKKAQAINQATDSKMHWIFEGQGELSGEERKRLGLKDSGKEEQTVPPPADAPA